MVWGSNLKSFCMVALLIAEATQAVTPDIASLASTMLFHIVEAIIQRGESRANHCPNVGCLTIHTEKSPPHNGAIPLEGGSDVSAPEEVCLASFKVASRLGSIEAVNSHKSGHVPFEPDLLSVHSGRPGLTYPLELVPCSSALIHSLCRMTC
jgi:hypothetical protein